MSDYLVNILPLCPDRDKDTLFKECLACLSTASSVDTWYGHKRLFDVTMGDQQIILSGGKIHIKDYGISIINEGYPQNRSLVDDWMKKFNLLVLYCDARTLSNYRDRIAVIRNLLHSRNRSSDVFLYLTHIGDVMDIKEMPTEQQTLIGIYSALSPEPSCATKLKDPYSGCSLYSSYWLDQHFSRYHDNSRHCFFQLPRGVICDCGHDSGYCDLLLAIIKCSLSQKHIVLNKSIGHPVLINRNIYQFQNNNNMNIVQSFFPSISKKSQDKKTIRLAVVGNSGHGKTFFLQDFCETLSKLNFSYKHDDNILFFPFSSHADFKADIHNPIYKVNQTVPYACRQNNHYVGVYSKKNEKVRIEFLDIPGEIFNDDSAMNYCRRIIEKLEGWNGKKDRWFRVTYWNRGNNETIRIVTFEGKKESTKTIENIHDEEVVLQKSGITDNYPVRRMDYIPLTDYLHMLEKEGYSKGEKTDQINGKELLEDFFYYDANSVFEALNNDFVKDRRLMEGIEEGKINVYLKYLYFFVFLYYATDIVLCQRVDKDCEITQIVDKLSMGFKGLNKSKPKYYLAFKGSDTFLKGAESQALFENCGRDLNSFYSFFTANIDTLLYNHTFQDTSNLYKNVNEKRFVKIDDGAPIVIEKRNVPGKLVKKCITIFSEKLYDVNDPKRIPPHVYFCATPIDCDFEINQFESAGNEGIINGDSGNPGDRVCFGTVQLVMDIIENTKDVKCFLYDKESIYSQPGMILTYLQGRY